MTKFKVGDKVVPSAKAYEDFPANDFGNAVGVIIAVGEFSRYCEVSWEEGGEYCYYDEHLDHIVIPLENE